MFAGKIYLVNDDNGLVIAVGSINVDVVVRVARLPGPGETVVGGTLERHGGGKGANQAVAAARAGARVHMVGAVGADDFGAAAVAELQAEAIDCAGVAVLEDQATGLAAITVDEQGENQIAVASGANAAIDPSAVKSALDDLAPGPDAVLLLSFELGDAPLEAAAGWAGARGIERVVLNPAPARAISAGLLAARPLLTPNTVELRGLAGETEDVGACAAGLAARTGAPVVVTLGHEGALIAGAGEPRRIPAPAVRALDSTGAGDAFNGALAAALAQGHELEAAVRRAVRAASASVTARGARGRTSTRYE